MKVQTIVVYIRTIAQSNPKTTRIVVKGAIAFIVAFAAKRGLDLSDDVLSIFIMIILTWLGINTADGGKSEISKETVSITTSSPQADAGQKQHAEAVGEALQSISAEKRTE